MKRFFILGTDTDCGKTYVTCQLVHYFKKQQARVCAIKPVASGCSYYGSQWLCADDFCLDEANGEHIDLAKSWRLEQPISPHIAAEASGQKIEVDALIEACALNQFDTLDYLLIEGAGGLMVPLNQHETWVDFLVKSQIPVILVVGMRLGCLNHALLTEHVLKAHGISCAGWIANALDESMQALAENISTLERKIAVPLLGKVALGGAFIPY